MTQEELQNLAECYIVVEGYTDENGISYVGLMEFLLNPEILPLRL